MQKAEPAASPAEKDRAEEMKAKAGELKAKADEMKAKADELKAKADEMKAQADELKAKAEEMKAKIAEIKAKIAEKVRGDSQERSALTPEDIIAELDDDLRSGRTAISAILTEMATEDGFKDIKAITTATGLVFVYSDTYITADDAAAKSLVEEAKFMLASAIRADSRDNVKLTPVGALYALAPDTGPTIIDALLKGIRTEARFADIKTVTASNGDVYFHSDKYLVGNDAVTLLMAMAGDHCATIAETVREESKIYPRTTNVAIFREQQVYGIPPNDLDAIIVDTLGKPEYADIKKIVHPSTGAVHLYSNQYMNEAQAWAMMDWEEVGRANNP
ncbi:MAG: hypothetical protein NTY86_16885 [Deltaproteobacteria bacterium]|nr:hypothetical protein [Deltaproteobacteria bacterium]